MRLIIINVILAALLSLAKTARAGDTALKEGDRLALFGDSITEIRGYTRQLETYIELCSGFQDVKVFSFGWGGERTPVGAGRLENDVLPWHPTIVAALYGANDAEYSEYSDANAKKFTDGLASMARQLKAKNIRFIISSPTCLDPQSFTIKPGGAARAEMINKTLSRMAVDAYNVAKQEQAGFSDLNSGMFATMQKAKETYGKDYIVCGDDGVHPGANGDILITLAYLNALEVNGTIAKITMDAKTGKATVSAGHKLISNAPGRIEVESLRYPYCFSTDPAAKKRKHSVESILPLIDFENKHNLFELKVSGLNPGLYTVSWGRWSKDFSSEQLNNGINLAAEFTENPFSAQFSLYFEGTSAKESLETWSVKNVISARRDLQHQKITDLKDKFDAVAEALLEKQAQCAAELKKLHIPIRHVITVEKSKNQQN